MIDFISRLPRLNYRVLFLGLCLSLWASQTAHSQAIDVIGSDETLEIATWNIEWFGATGSGQGPSDVVQQRANVRRVITESGIDFWAVQEISDTSQWQFLLNELGPSWEGRLATISGQQRIGFVYNTDTIQMRLIKHILETYSTGPSPPAGTNYFAGRPPLQIRVDVVLPDTTVALTFITLHMKCCGDLSSYERRIEASNRLKTNIDFSYGVLNEPIAAILGDFNDELSGSIRAGQPSPYVNFLDSPDYSFLTLPLDDQNIPTFCSSTNCAFGSTLDHILITDEVVANYVDGSVSRLESVLDAIPNYTNSTSDHVPVYAVFTFPTNTAVDEPGEIPGSLSIQSAFPNPARNALNIRLLNDKPGSVEVAIFDVLGRRVYSETLSGAETASGHTVSTSGFANGLYVIRASTLTASAERTFLKWE